MASKRAIRRRACDGKRRYADAKEARGGVWNLRRSGKAEGAMLAVYRCQFCGGFHFGHPPARVRQSMRTKASATE